MTDGTLHKQVPSERARYLLKSETCRYGTVLPSIAGETLVWTGTASYDDRYSGQLKVTNKRLVFEFRKGRLIAKGIASVQIPLMEISSVSIERGPWNWNVLTVVSRGKTHRFIIKESDPRAWMGKIEELVSRKASSTPGKNIQPS